MDVLDSVFKAYDVRGLYEEQITEDLAWRIGHAAAQYLRGQLSGYDRGQASANRCISAISLCSSGGTIWRYR